MKAFQTPGTSGLPSRAYSKGGISSPGSPASPPRGAGRSRVFHPLGSPARQLFPRTKVQDVHEEQKRNGLGESRELPLRYSIQQWMPGTSEDLSAYGQPAQAFPPHLGGFSGRSRATASRPCRRSPSPISSQFWAACSYHTPPSHRDPYGNSISMTPQICIPTRFPFQGDKLQGGNTWTLPLALLPNERLLHGLAGSFFLSSNTTNTKSLKKW